MIGVRHLLCLVSFSIYGDLVFPRLSILLYFSNFHFTTTSDLPTLSDMKNLNHENLRRHQIEKAGKADREIKETI